VDIRMRSILITALILFAANASAATITIDFEEPGIDLGPAIPGPGALFEGPVHTQGFDFYSERPGIVAFALSEADGDHVLIWGSSGAMYFEAEDQSPFDLVSADIGDFGSATYRITGVKADGGKFIWDNGWCGTADEGVNQYCPDMFEGEHIDWTNLVSVTVDASNDFGSIDNIVISQVPVPAALWLFGSALAGLGWMKRIRTD
jgi:hypothetical protein